MHDPRMLWIVGAIMLIFCSVALATAAMVIALPIYVVASLLGASQDTLTKTVLYSAVLWAPLGFGAGVTASSTLVRGIRRKRDPQSQD